MYIVFNTNLLERGLSQVKKFTTLLLILCLTASIAVGCGTPTQENTTTKEDSPAQNADIVVIGAGGAGLSAAVQATEDGANVIVLEKMPMVGGNTLRATGGLNACNTDVQKEKGIEDSVDLFVKDTIKGGHDKNDPELVKTLAENSADVVKWLSDLGADLSDLGRTGGASVPRAHRPEGGAAVGPNLVKALDNAAKEKNIDVRLETEAKEILKDDDGNIIGVKAIDKDGKEYTIDTKAVIIATGGFGANHEMVEEYKPELKGFATTNHAGATGDGIKMAEKVGADFVDLDQIQIHPTVIPNEGTLITEGVRGDGAILVNHDGKRFINELETRDVVSKAILDQEGENTAFLIFNDKVRSTLKAVESYFEQDLVFEGETIEDLAKEIDIDAENLKSTLDTYNEYVAGGEDKDFGRPVEVSLSEGNYYAIEITPAIHHTMGGIKINTNAEVLDKDGQVIKGLYAAGEVTGGVHGANRLGGNAVADITVFGKIAGNNAAKFVKDSK